MGLTIYDFEICEVTTSTCFPCLPLPFSIICLIYLSLPFAHNQHSSTLSKAILSRSDPLARSNWYLDAFERLCHASEGVERESKREREKRRRRSYVVTVNDFWKGIDRFQSFQAQSRLFNTLGFNLGLPKQDSCRNRVFSGLPGSI